jgi:FtsH-binding integral membrane protein
MQIYTYDANGYNEKQKRVVAESSTYKGLAKVYLWFGLGILLTGIMTVGWPYFISWISPTAEAFADNFYISLIVFVILLLPLGFAVSLSGISRHSALIKTFYVLYSIAMGGALSTLTLAFNYDLLLYSFIVSALAFFLMGGLGYWTKGKIGVVLPFLFAFLFGALMISLFNLLLVPVLPGASATSYGLYWIVSFVVLAVYLIFAAVDTNRVMRIARAKGFEDNDTFAVYCAYGLYSDFILIFLYILRFLALFSSKNRN